jgi:DNA-directed RNA polymerase specialized sigma subunit
MDMQIIPGNPDPEGRILGNIEQIKREQRKCKAVIREVEGELAEIERLLEQTKRLSGKPGQVIRWLYIDRKTWDEVQDELDCAKSTVSYHRRKGIEKLANKLYSKTKRS